MRFTGGRFSLTGAALLLLSGACFAQSAEGRLEEIVVTAQKRQQSLQDVPISATVITERLKELAGARRFRDLQFLIPNLIFRGNETHGTTRIALRGIATDRRNIGFNSGVGMYVNGVYQGSIAAYNQDLLDIERVEVLRGPQGTLFGRNTLVGAINVTTKKPDLHDYSGRVAAGFGNYGAVTGEGLVNIPLVAGKTGARLGLSYANSDGYVKNLFDGSRLANEDELAFRGQLRLVPQENLTIDLEADWANEDRKGFNGGFFDPVPGGLAETAGIVSPSPWDVFYDLNNREQREQGGVSLTASYALQNGGELTAITAWRAVDIDEFVEGDRSPFPFTVVDFVDEQSQFTQELRWTSPQYDKWNWVLGLYYLQQEDETDRTLEFNEPGFAGVRNVAASIDTLSYALYGHTEVSLTDALTLFGGARVSVVSKDLLYEQFATAPGSVQTIPLSADDYSETNFSPTIGLRARLRDGLQAYAKVGQGFKSGGFNADYIIDTREIQFDSENVVNYEIGVKSELLDNRLRLNGAIFYMDYEDQQVSVFRGNDLGFRVDNAATAEVTGFELELNALLLESLEVSAGVGYTDATYDDYNDNAGNDFSGKRLINAPEETANLNVTYTRPIGTLGDFLARVEYVHRGDLYTSPANTDASYLESTKLINARLGIDADNGWSVHLWARNLTDEQNVNFGFNSGAFGARMNQYDPPRTYGVRVQYVFR